MDEENPQGERQFFEFNEEQTQGTRKRDQSTQIQDATQKNEETITKKGRK